MPDVSIALSQGFDVVSEIFPIHVIFMDTSPDKMGSSYNKDKDPKVLIPITNKRFYRLIIFATLSRGGVRGNCKCWSHLTP